MHKIAIAVHAGAGPDSEFIRKNEKEHKEGLKQALEAGYDILKKRGTAVNAVEAAIRSLEDNPIFNAGRGSALNANGIVEMDVSIMDGENLKAGALSTIKYVKNPITFAKLVMENAKSVFLGGDEALKLAEKMGLELKTHSYFITQHQLEEYIKEKDKHRKEPNKQLHGTVGTVALDRNGNLAAGTSTGGTPYCQAGRIGDSCVIGAGCYANNNTCAVSGTGDGEDIIKAVLAYSVSAIMEYKGLSMQEACSHIIHQKNKNTKADMGIVGIDPKGKIGISFNSERMLRAWQSEDEPLQVMIYK